MFFTLKKRLLSLWQQTFQVVNGEKLVSQICQMNITNSCAPLAHRFAFSIYTLNSLNTNCIYRCQQKSRTPGLTMDSFVIETAERSILYCHLSTTAGLPNLRSPMLFANILMKCSLAVCQPVKMSSKKKQQWL